MRSAVTDGVAWCFCLSVSWSFCHNLEPFRNGQTDQDAVWDVHSGGPLELCIRWGSRRFHAKGQFWGGKCYLHGKRMAERARSTILIQQNLVFRYARPSAFQCVFMAALCNRGAIIFLPCNFFLSIFLSFFPRLISAAAGWMSTILWHMVWP